MKVATNIPTERWNNIISELHKAGWAILEKYDRLDKGIDFDFVILKRQKERVYFGWDNWVEGEIKCKDSLMHQLEHKFGEFNYGKPVNLKSSVIILTRFQIAFNKLRNWLYIT